MEAQKVRLRVTVLVANGGSYSKDYNFGETTDRQDTRQRVLDWFDQYCRGVNAHGFHIPDGNTYFPSNQIVKIKRTDVIFD